MITCLDAHRLFDRYLDGELSASLQTELHAHRLHCTVCQNELSLMEACGDVIAVDRCEPQVGASFTNRVLLANRAGKAPKRRQWGRLFWMVSTPTAAAASLAFMMFTVVPAARTTVVSPSIEAVPAEVQMKLLEKSQQPRTQQELAELRNTPQMSTDSFIASMAAPLVEWSKNTYEDTRRTAEGFEWLWRTGNETLIARLRAQEQSSSKAASSERGGAELDPLDPSYLLQPPADPDGSDKGDSEDHTEAI